MSSAHSASGPATDRLATPLSAMAPEVKVLALVGFLLVVALTPAHRPWAFAVYAVVVAVVAAVALLPLRTVAGRLLLEIPVALVAVTYVLAGRGPHTEIAGLTLSRPGLWVAFGLLAKATIGVLAVSVVAASTTATELVAGLARLRVPSWFTDQVALAARQVEVLRAEAARIRLAAELRGSVGRWATWRAASRGLGTLFVRSAERSERLATAVELRGSGDGVALVGRGAAPAATPTHWVLAAVPVVVAVVGLAVAMGLAR